MTESKADYYDEIVNILSGSGAIIPVVWPHDMPEYNFYVDAAPF